MNRVVFDLDGTLFRTDMSFIGAVQAALADFGLPPAPPEQIAAHIGKSTRQFLRDFLPPGSDNEAFARALKSRECEMRIGPEALYPGVRDMLSALHCAGFSLFILSSGSPDYIEHVVNDTGIAGYFSGLHSSRDDPDKSSMLRQIAAEEDFTVMVGDRVYDFAAAKTCRLPGIAATYGYGGERECAQADFLADTAAQIADLIFTLFVFHRLKRRLIDNRHCRVIGISGVDTSGKTVFSARLSRYLFSLGLVNTVLHLDDFHNPASLRRKGSSELEAYFDHAFDLQKLVSEVLHPLKARGSLHRTVRCLDLDTDKYDREISLHIEDADIVLLEGVLLFRPPVDDYLDARVWLDISFDEVLRRARLRDVPKYGEIFMERYRTKYIPVQQKFMEEFDPKGKSDAVINNDNYNRPEYFVG